MFFSRLRAKLGLKPLDVGTVKAEGNAISLNLAFSPNELIEWTKSMVNTSLCTQHCIEKVLENLHIKPLDAIMDQPRINYPNSYVWAIYLRRLAHFHG